MEQPEQDIWLTLPHLHKHQPPDQEGCDGMHQGSLRSYPGPAESDDASRQVLGNNVDQ